MKRSVVIPVFALVVCALIALGLNANAVVGSSSGNRPELEISYKSMRAYDPATNAFTGRSYLVKTLGGPGCSAVFAAEVVAVAQIEALAMDGDTWVWSGTRASFADSGPPNPCP